LIWDRLTSPEIAALPKETPVLLPLAATEQHGPHLPLATDRLIAERLARALEQRVPERLLVLPVVWAGCSEHHMGFSGTLSIRHETFASAVIELLQSVASHGFRNLLMLNAHGGNSGIARVILERFGSAHPECNVVVTEWWRVAAEALSGLSETGPGGVGHACEFETSLVLHLAPELVRTDAIPDGGNVPTYRWAEGDMLRAAPAVLYRSFRAMTSNGVYGQPSAATAEKGAAIERAVVEALEEVVRSLAKPAGPTGS
jgi:creatinine amidohydrolase